MMPVSFRVSSSAGGPQLSQNCCRLPPPPFPRLCHPPFPHPPLLQLCQPPLPQPPLPQPPLPQPPLCQPPLCQPQRQPPFPQPACHRPQPPLPHQVGTRAPPSQTRAPISVIPVRIAS